MTYYTVLEGSDFEYVPEGSTCDPDYLSSFIKLKPDLEFVSGYVFAKKIGIMYVNPEMPEKLL